MWYSNSINNAELMWTVPQVTLIKITKHHWKSIWLLLSVSFFLMKDQIIILEDIKMYSLKGGKKK